MPLDIWDDDDELLDLGRGLDLDPAVERITRGSPLDIGIRDPLPEPAQPAVQRRGVPNGRGRGVTNWEWERARADQPGRGRGPPKDRGFRFHPREERDDRGRGRR